MLTFQTGENLNSDDHSDLTIKSDTGQHLRFLLWLQNINPDVTIKYVDFPVALKVKVLNFDNLKVGTLSAIQTRVCGQS